MTHKGSFKTWWWTVAGCAALVASPVHADLTRLQGLLNATPEGGWVQVNTSTWRSAWPTGADVVPNAGNSVVGVVAAWSGVAWDSANDNLLLWGGGHANYSGNEMYVWNAGTGVWGRGSVPSRIDASYFIVDNAAPQSAHTYDNNIYLPVNNMFATFGGAIYNSGGNFQTNINGNVQRAGPWLWDPTLADPDKVGGTTGSGYNTARLGGNMWTNRASSLTGPQAPNWVEETTAYRNEGGKDVVYITGDSQGSGWVSLYRYEFGDVRNGGTDTIQWVGVTEFAPSGLGASTIDQKNGLFVKTVWNYGDSLRDLTVWNLANNNPAFPSQNKDKPITLQFANGAPFAINNNYGIDYDAANERLLLWDGDDVFSTQAAYDTSGNLLSIWTVTQLTSSTLAHPVGTYNNCVCGKWKYVAELGAFIALDEYQNTTQDAGVWLYKPYSVAAVPEAPPWAMMVPGLLALGAWRVRRRRNGASLSA